MEVIERETLRLALISAGAKYVFATAEGSGDSSSDYWIKAYTTFDTLGLTLKKYVKTTPVRTASGFEYEATESRAQLIDKDGKVIVDENAYKFLVGDVDRFDAVKEFEHVPFDQFKEIEGLRDELKTELGNLLDYVVGQEASWDFNNDGSSGWFLWDLEKNIARVTGYYNISSTEDFGDFDPLGIEEKEDEDIV